MLDAIRETEVAAGEAGGITQHIGAYEARIDGRRIVFIDTPGHEAFTRMRSRGAKVTDIVVLVVSADDGVMPQTEEAIAHAQAANTKIIVAINKIDKPGAEPERVKRQLSDRKLMPEEWGGDTVMVEVSAKTKQNVPKLLEMILLVGDLLELKADPDAPASGTVLESRVDKGRGPVATVLVQNGTLHVGDFFVVGAVYGKVRAMFDDHGPSDQASRAVDAGRSARSARRAGSGRSIPGDGRSESAPHRRIPARQAARGITCENSFGPPDARSIARAAQGRRSEGSAGRFEGGRARVGGSAERNAAEAFERSGEAESDSGERRRDQRERTCCWLRLRTRLWSDSTCARKEKRPNWRSAKAWTSGCTRLFTKLLDELKKAVAGLLAPVIKETYLGRAEVRNTFRVKGVGMIAGCSVQDGILKRDAEVRVLRDNVVIYTGRISSLRRFKDDANEVRAGFECGVGVSNFSDVKVGDILECFKIEKTVAPEFVNVGRSRAAAGKRGSPAKLQSANLAIVRCCSITRARICRSVFSPSKFTFPTRNPSRISGRCSAA